MESPSPQVFDNEFMRLEWREGIIIGTYKTGPITLDMAKQVVKNRLEFSNNKPVPILINDIGLKSIEKEAREFLSSDAGIEGLIAGALVTNATFGRHLANFFIRISVVKPKIPTRLFSNEDEAISWLRQFL